MAQIYLTTKNEIKVMDYILFHIKKLKDHVLMLEKRVAQRTGEIENKVTEIKRMNKFFIGRELRMAS